MAIDRSIIEIIERSMSKPSRFIIELDKIGWSYEKSKPTDENEKKEKLDQIVAYISKDPKIANHLINEKTFFQIAVGTDSAYQLVLSNPQLFSHIIPDDTAFLNLFNKAPAVAAKLCDLYIKIRYPTLNINEKLAALETDKQAFKASLKLLDFILLLSLCDTEQQSKLLQYLKTNNSAELKHLTANNEGAFPIHGVIDICAVINGKANKDNFGTSVLLNSKIFLHFIDDVFKLNDFCENFPALQKKALQIVCNVPEIFKTICKDFISINYLFTSFKDNKSMQNILYNKILREIKDAKKGQWPKTMEDIYDLSLLWKIFPNKIDEIIGFAARADLINIQTLIDYCLKANTSKNTPLKIFLLQYIIFSPDQFAQIIKSNKDMEILRQLAQNIKMPDDYKNILQQKDIHQALALIKQLHEQKDASKLGAIEVILASQKLSKDMISEITKFFTPKDVATMKQLSKKIKESAEEKEGTVKKNHTR